MTIASSVYSYYNSNKIMICSAAGNGAFAFGISVLSGHNFTWQDYATQIILGGYGGKIINDYLTSIQVSDQTKDGIATTIFLLLAAPLMFSGLFEN